MDQSTWVIWTSTKKYSLSYYCLIYGSSCLFSSPCLSCGTEEGARVSVRGEGCQDVGYRWVIPVVLYYILELPCVMSYNTDCHPTRRVTGACQGVNQTLHCDWSKVVCAILSFSLITEFRLKKKKTHIPYSSWQNIWLCNIQNCYMAAQPIQCGESRSKYDNVSISTCEELKSSHWYHKPQYAKLVTDGNSHWLSQSQLINYYPVCPSRYCYTRLHASKIFHNRL